MLFWTLHTLTNFIDLDLYGASEKHREAAGTLIPSVIAAMKRAGNCGAVQAQGDLPTSTQHPFH